MNSYALQQKIPTWYDAEQPNIVSVYLTRPKEPTPGQWFNR